MALESILSLYAKVTFIFLDYELLFPLLRLMFKANSLESTESLELYISDLSKNGSEINITLAGTDESHTIPLPVS